nr:efflux RND transporter permease subunit [Zoogloeaceae bacterium]
MNRLNLSEWALSHRSFVIFIMIVSMLAGAIAFRDLGRNEDPPFTFRTMVVQAAWPGATMDETLLQVTERLERKLQETTGLDSLRSITVPGRTTIFVDLRGDTSPRQVEDTWYRVRRDVADIRHTLPAGIVGPGFNDSFGDTFGLIYGFTADGFTHRELRDQVEIARSRLLLVPDVSIIDLIGEQEERVHIEFSVDQLAALGLNQAQLLTALAAQNVVRPAGTVITDQERLTVRVSGVFDSEEDILDVNFVSNGRLVRLRDIAAVKRELADPPQPMFRVNGKPSIGLAIAMRDGGDVLALGENIASAMREVTAELPVGIEATLVANQPEVVDEAINDFMLSLWQSIAIILAVSFISLGVRAGLVVALSFPLTLGIVFPLMMVAGIDLQRISLGALIIALTLLVDNAMTTVDAMTSRIAQGHDKKEAASFAYRTLAVPMLTGTFISAAGFLPIGFARSAAGEYTFSIFAVVAISLVVSWFVAVIFSPLVGVAALKESKGGEPAGPGPVMKAFRGILVTAMRARWLTVIVTLVVFAVALAATPLLPRQFFPASDRPELLVDVALPANASIHTSAAAVDKVEKFLSEQEEVDHWSTYIGKGAIRFYLPLNVELANDAFSQLVVVAHDMESRLSLEPKLVKFLAEELPESVSRVSPLELGPPVGWPIQYRVAGPDVEKVRNYAVDLAKLMAENPNMQSISFDWIEPSRVVHVHIDQDQARRLGLNSSTLASVLQTTISGVPITQLRDDIYLIDVVARAEADVRTSLAALRSLQVPLPDGRSIPITQFASFSFGQEQPLVWRRDRVPTLTVQADLVGDIQPATVVGQMTETVAAFNASLPVGYSVVAGGSVEESANSQASVIAVVPMMVLMMLTFLMMQLQSFNRMLLVLSVIPLGLIGIVGALLIANRPLGFVAILGILALIGMIARNAVILIEQVEADRNDGMHGWDAVIAASMSRFRPITLTAISTVLGMIPIAGTIFWGPMAIAIMGGLTVATVLTLIFLPTLYVVWFGIREPTEKT